MTKEKIHFREQTIATHDLNRDWEAGDHHAQEISEKGLVDPWEVDVEVETHAPEPVILQQSEIVRKEEGSVPNTNTPSAYEEESFEQRWDNVPLQTATSEVETIDRSFDDDSVDDWADSGFAVFSMDAETLTESHADLDIYDENEHQPPWELEPIDDHSVRIARQKAAEITALIVITHRQEHDSCLAMLTELFKTHRHHATFRAIKSATSNDITLGACPSNG